MDGARAIFLSYSRKDYYFAESLAFELLAQGCKAWLDAKDLQPGGDWRGQLEAAIRSAPAFVLLASRHSLASSHVRSEWELAIASSRPIVVVHLDRTRLPEALAAYPAVSLRGRFKSAVARLAALLRAPASTAAVKARPSLLVLPPWVAFVSLALVLPAVAFLALSDWSAQPDGMLAAFPNPVLGALVVLGSLWLLWFVALAFVQRRMGMTRLAICLGVIGGAYAYPIHRYLMHGADGLQDYKGHIAQFLASHMELAMTLAALPLAALAAVVLLRPADLLRWSPTGKVWPWYRVGRAIASEAQIADAATAFARVRRFVLVHDPADAPAAARLRAELIQAGASEVAGAPDSARAAATHDTHRASAPPGTAAPITTVILLTQLSRVALIDAQRQVDGSVLAVVGTGIRMQEALDWLWRRQWIDFRAWTLVAPDREQGLPRVPEALTRTRVPAAVRTAHQLLCAIGALIFLAGGANPELQQAGGYSDAQPQWGDTAHAFVLFAVWIWFATLARRLLRRRIAQRDFYRWLYVGFPFAIGIALYDLIDPLMQRPDGWRVLPPMLLPPLALVWFVRTRGRFDYWFPVAGAWRGAEGERLGMERNWDTLVWFIAWLLLLALVSGLAQS